MHVVEPSPERRLVQEMLRNEVARRSVELRAACTAEREHAASRLRAALDLLKCAMLGAELDEPENERERTL